MGLKLDECGGFIGASRFPISLANGNENLLAAVRDNVDRVRETLIRNGALLLRGFAVTRNSFGEVVDLLCGARLEYVYRSTPRTSVADRIFTATNYPPDREIPLHCEEAYQRNWPMLLAFYCEQPATEGGETPLADIVKVTAGIDPELVQKFRQRGVCYIRNYLDGIDLPWTDVFQTRSRAEVERFCAKHDIRFDWGRDDSLHTTQICQGTAVHPDSGDELWFNQAHLFHASSLGAGVAQDMIEAFGVDGLPRNAVYGDGAEIADEELATIRTAFKQESVTFRWQKDDVLLLDNMQVAHGRHRFSGQRSVLVAMGRPRFPE
ncbi:MAG TPA: TauD/TfdA family dioxygenase [Methylosinus sp.]|uniref:TauD/TfdA family dioxygenase n=1 Tax=Methylosinus sp. TaxID=427 RepID=UPI002F923992